MHTCGKSAAGVSRHQLGCPKALAASTGSPRRGLVFGLDRATNDRRSRHCPRGLRRVSHARKRDSNRPAFFNQPDAVHPRVWRAGVFGCARHLVGAAVWASAGRRAHTGDRRAVRRRRILHTDQPVRSSGPVLLCTPRRRVVANRVRILDRFCSDGSSATSRPADPRSRKSLQYLLFTLGFGGSVIVDRTFLVCVRIASASSTTVLLSRERDWPVFGGN